MRRLRGLLAAAAAAAAAAGAGGCAPPPGNAPWPPPAGGGVTVTLVTGTDSSAGAGDKPVNSYDHGMYQELTDWWNAHEATVTGITIKLDVIDGGSATVDHSEMLAAAQAGDGRYDIYNLDGQWVPEFASAGYIRLLDGHLDTTGFLPQPLASGKDTAGRLYAAPFTTDVGLLYYRTDLVPDAPRLDSFEAVMRAAGQARSKDPAITEGYAGQFAAYEGLTVNLLEIIRGYALGAIGPDGTIRDITKVADGLRQLVDQIGGQVPGSELSASEAQSYSAFATGKAVFMRNWPIYYDRLVTAASGVRFTVTPLPFPSVLGGQDLAISRDSPHPAEALQVIRFLTSVQAERCLFQVGGFPATRQDAYSRAAGQGARASGGLDTGYQAPGYPAVTGQPMCGDQPGRQLTIAKDILRAISKAIPRPVTPYYTEFSTLVQDQVWPLLHAASQGNSIDLRAAIATLAADIQLAASGHAPAHLGG